MKNGRNVGGKGGPFRCLVFSGEVLDRGKFEGESWKEWGIFEKGVFWLYKVGKIGYNVYDVIKA